MKTFKEFKNIVNESSEIDKVVARIGILKHELHQANTNSKNSHFGDDDWADDQEERIKNAEAKLRDLKSAGHKVSSIGHGPRTASGRSDVGGPGVREGIDIANSKMADVIKDFQGSDAPQFDGKSDKKRKEMAIAAKLAADRNESVKEDETDDPKSKKKDKLNLKPKLENETMKQYKDIISKLREKKSQVKEETKIDEAVLENGVEYEESSFDDVHRLSQAYPNLDVNFAKYMDEGLEGPYNVGGEDYFYDRKVHMFYSVSGEDYVDEETAKDIVYRLHRDGLYKPELGR